MSNIPNYEDNDYSLKLSSYEKAIAKRPKGITETTVILEKIGLDRNSLVVDRFTIDWFRRNEYELNDVQYGMNKEFKIFSYRTLEEGLPDNVKSIQDITVVNSISIYDKYGNNIFNAGQGFIVDISNHEPELHLEITYLPLGYLDPIVVKYPIVTFTHTPDKFLVLKCTTPFGNEIGFTRWVEEDDAIDIDRWPNHEIMGCEYVSIKTGFGKEVIAGSRLIIFKPRFDRLYSVPDNVAEI